MKIKEQMEKCFAMQHGFWQKQFNTYPKVPYVEEFENNELFINNLVDKEGYIEWQPKEQILSIKKEIIKSRIGVELIPQLVEFYSSYCFLELIGKMENGITVIFDRIPFGCDINEYIIQKYLDDNKVKEYCAEFNKYDLFEIGNAIVEGNDEYLVCFDNKSGKVLLIYFVEQIVLDLNITLYDLFNLFIEVY